MNGSGGFAHHLAHVQTASKSESADDTAQALGIVPMTATISRLCITLLAACGLACFQQPHVGSFDDTPSTSHLPVTCLLHCLGYSFQLWILCACFYKIQTGVSCVFCAPVELHAVDTAPPSQVMIVYSFPRQDLEPKAFQCELLASYQLGFPGL